MMFYLQCDDEKHISIRLVYMYVGDVYYTRTHNCKLCPHQSKCRLLSVAGRERLPISVAIVKERDIRNLCVI